MNPLGKQILKDVSRSFYLSIRLLPAAMREPVSLGYLLARASDTLADTPNLPAELRAETLTDFHAILHGADPAPWLARIKKEIVPLQTHEGERSLLENLDGILDWLSSLTDSEKTTTPYTPTTMAQKHHAAILTVMEHILRGQRLDIERFELQEGFHFTLDAELEEYCYLVAGCVGEFWSDIGFISLANFSSVELSRLKQWGSNYGKALQLINILRDLPEDRNNGRCYLPNVDLTDTDALLRESARWRTRARGYLADGQSYAQSLNHRRTRAATALPGLIGERTLDLMDTANWSALAQGIKIPRREVYSCAWQSFFV